MGSFSFGDCIVNSLTLATRFFSLIPLFLGQLRDAVCFINGTVKSCGSDLIIFVRMLSSSLVLDIANDESSIIRSYLR